MSPRPVQAWVDWTGCSCSFPLSLVTAFEALQSTEVVTVGLGCFPTECEMGRPGPGGSISGYLWEPASRGRSGHGVPDRW